MRFFEKTKGVISVFLALVLMPFLSLACIFVDMSRVELSKGVALSAADLTMNTLLTQYDADLVEYYGLMGFSQAESELLSGTQKYLEECMVSSGVTKSEAQVTVQQIINNVIGNGNTVQDLLQVSVAAAAGSETGTGTGSGSGSGSGTGTSTGTQTTEAQSLVTAAGDLADPGILKTQIIEFMKYRGPVELAESIITKLKEDDTAKKALENAEAESKLLTERQEFYKIENDLIEVLNGIKAFIKLYEEKELSSDEKLKEALKNFGEDPNYEAKIRPYHNNFVINMYDSHKYSGNGNRYDLFLYDYGNQISYPGDCTTYSPENPPTKEAVVAVIKKLASCISNFESKKSKFEETWSKNGKGYSTDYNSVQYWLYFSLGTDNGGSGIGYAYNDYVSALNKMMSAYVEADNACQNMQYNTECNIGGASLTLYDSDYPKVDAAVTSGSNVTRTVQTDWEWMSNQYDRYNIYDDIVDNDQSTYNIVRNNCLYVAKNDVANDSLKLINGTFQYEGSEYKFENFNIQLCRPLKELYDKLDEAGVAALMVYECTQNLEEDYGCADLPEMVTKYHNAFDAWYDAAKTAHEAGSELADGYDAKDDDEKGYTGDWEIVQHIKSCMESGKYKEMSGATEATKQSVKQSYDMLTQVTVNSTQEFISRYENICKTFGYFEDGAKNVTYEDVSLVDLEEKTETEFEKNIYDAIKAKFSNICDGITREDEAVNKQADDTFCVEGLTGFQSINWDAQESKIRRNAKDDRAIEGYDIAANAMPTVKGKENTPSVYTWVIDYEFKATELDEEGAQNEDEAKSQKETIDGQGNTEAQNADTNGNSTNKNEIKNLKNKPSDSVKADATPSGKNEAGTDKSTSFLESLDIASVLTAGRDILYTEEYIMNMFSWDTYDNEGCYNLLSDDEISKITCPSGFEEAYKSEDISKKWASEDVTFKDNKSLTNKMINSTNNWSFGNEVEYILYGGENTANKVAAYGSIYLIRYALDLAPVFREWYDDATVESVAAAINAFLFIPIPLTKTLICLALTAGEAGMDLAYLKKGVAVPFYKAKNCSLYVSYESIFGDPNKAKPVSNKSNALSLQYSGYLRIFLLAGLALNGDAIYARIGDVIQSNMAKARNFGDSYLLSNATVYFTMDVNLEVKPIMTLFTGIEEGMSKMATATSWRQFSLKLTRGYS